MGTLIVSVFARARVAVINVIKRNKYFFIVLFSCKDAKNTRGAAYSFEVKMKIVINIELHALTI